MIESITESQLRVGMAIRHASRRVLGKKHNAERFDAKLFLESALQHWQVREHQLAAENRCIGVMPHLFPEEPKLTEETVESWAKPNPPKPSGAKLRELDRLLSCDLTALSRDCVELDDDRLGFYESMVRGGLLARMGVKGDGVATLDRARSRSLGYRPISALHLHLDAIELCAWSGQQFKEEKWAQYKALAATRILELLFDRWNARTGAMYTAVPEQAQGVDQSSVSKRLIEQSPLFEGVLSRLASRPAAKYLSPFEQTSPLQVQNILLNLSKDRQFLRGSRLDAWALDFVTAGLAQFALAWCDRYQTLGSGTLREEMHCWAGVQSAFFTEDDLPTVMWRFGLEHPDALTAADVKDYQRLRDARRSYQELLRMHGVRSEQVNALVSSQWMNHPIAYQTNYRRPDKVKCLAKPDCSEQLWWSR